MLKYTIRDQWLGKPEVMREEVLTSFVEVSQIKECLADNIKTNKGRLVLSRDFVRGIVESTILKNSLKLKTGASFDESVEIICDKLAGPGPEVSYHSCTVDIPVLCRNIRTAILEQTEEDLAVYEDIRDILDPVARTKLKKEGEYDV